MRPTADVVILALTALVAVVVLVTVAGMVAAKLRDPGADVGEVARAVGVFVSTIVGVILGYLGGQARRPQ